MTIYEIEKQMSSQRPERIEGEEAQTYCIETSSECNLKCVLCGFGSRELFTREKGIMDLELFKKIIDEIAKRSPHAAVFPYCVCEPLLHPDMPEMVRYIKKYNLRCGLSTNLNITKGLKEIIEAGPDFISVSVSGFYQDTYSKNHICGNIEKVKENVLYLKQLTENYNKNVKVDIYYHMYKDNLGEDFDMMKKFAEENGCNFSPVWSRAINMELALKHLRENNLSKYTGPTEKWLDDTPPLGEKYKDAINRIIHLPEDYTRGKWENINVDECLLNHAEVNIKWNGKISICPYSFDDHMLIGDYLTTSPEALIEARKNCLVCKECLANNYVFYTNFFDMESIDEIARTRLPSELASDRRFFGEKGTTADEIIKFCSEHEEIYIFGAGRYGKLVQSFLNENKIKVSGIIVSDDKYCKNSDENILSAEQYRKISVDVQNSGIIIALNPDNKKSAEKTLSSFNTASIWASDRAISEILKRI